MRTILLAASLTALLCPLLCAGPGAIAQPAPKTDPDPVAGPAQKADDASAPFSPSRPSDADESPEAFDGSGTATPEAPAAPEPPPNPNAVTARRPAILNWWDAPAFDRRVTLVLKDADLNTAIDGLGKAANMSLIAAGGSKARKKVTLNLRGAPLRDVMLAIANLYSLTWFRSGEVYTLTYISASMKRTGGAAAPALPRTRRSVIVVPEQKSGRKTTGTSTNRSRDTTAPPGDRVKTLDRDSPTPPR